MATLNVKDALSYLDQVKVQFAEQPDVYNRFLDIMKDFKSQSIDTPGVIERVSTLFRGHPSLIQGFNTFLPPGYRIECSLDPSENNLITVTTPTGTTTQTPGGVGIAGAINRVNAAGAAAAGSGAGSAGATGSAASTSTGPGAPSTSGAGSGAAQLIGSSPVAAGRGGAAGGQDGPIMPFTPGGHGMQPQLSAGAFAAASNQGLGGLGGSNAPATPGATAGAGVLSHGSALGGLADPRRPPVEFNHAINYVNKIKQRFSNDPETYKQFLEILQTYQKEQRPIQDVYAEVTILFDKARDLLEEFKQFLPDTSANQPQAGLFGALGQATMGAAQSSIPAPSAIGHRDGLPIDAAGGPRTKSGAGAGGTGKSKKRGAAADPGAAAAATGVGAAGAVPGAAAGKAGGQAGSASKSKKSKHSHKTNDAQMRSSPIPQGAEQPMSLPHPGHMQAFVGPDGTVIHADTAVAAGMMPAIGPNGMPLAPGQVALASLDEVAFFDRIKRHIDDRGVYLEFLKLLNLFTQDIIDVRTLIDRAALFIGNHRELFSTLKSLCGYDMGKHGWLENEDPIIENVPALQRERTDLNTCKQYGASYRKLPKTEINLACSGRDPMCWEVLNDIWVSHPTWASEGESFNPHKKNIYEDALYRSEEERHEYDYHIEANLRTIALLEPIAARISTMDNEERASFRLKPGLGGQSKSIYQRVIKKVYGRDHGLEVISALHDNPCVAVPVVLARLKQKDEEWKRAQREWNKVWREVDARNYYKSLDHQGINFKTIDKKTITTKAFVAEIETRRTQQQQRRLNIDPSLPRARPRYQLAYVMDDLQVLTDVLKLSFSFLDRANFSKSDSDRIEQFLRTFVPNLLALQGEEFEELLAGDEDDDDDDGASIGTASALDDDTGSNASANSSANSKRGNTGRKQQADLRRRLLKSQAESSGAAKEAMAAEEGANAAESETADGETPGKANCNMDNGDAEMADETGKDAGEANGRDNDAQMMDAENAAAAPAGEGRTSWIQADLNQTFTSGQSQPANGEAVPKAPPAARKQNLFCNTTFYVFIRLFQLLYSRLHKIKSLALQKTAQYPHKRRINPVAVELGLQDGSTGPAGVVGAVSTSAGVNNREESGLFLHPSRYYDTVLDLCEKLFDAEVDQATFEEAVRYMFGIDGYVVFTIDKAVSAFVKTAQSLTTDQKCQELLALFERDRTRQYDETSAYKQQIENRMAAEAIISKDENLFRVEWIPTSSTMLVQMLSKDDLTLDDPATAEQKWLYYMSSYCLWQPTEGLPGEAQAPFLKRSIPANVDADMDVKFTVKTNLEIKICIRTYRLFFVSGTEDVFARHRKEAELKRFEENSKVLRKKKLDRFNAWLESKVKA